MGKVASIAAASAILLAVILVPLHTRAVRAQTLPSVTCSGTPATTPMQGHYTGSWHSDGDYHFLALGHDIDLKITIDGTIDAIVSPDGHMTGTVQGTVDAPLTHDGQKDVSSGKGTITGTLTGLLGPGSSTAVLSAPVILMHWGTFGAGGYTADRYITMPDYQFPIANMDCVSSNGTISETDFPVQYIVADFQGNLAQAPGIGGATGTWHLASADSGVFADLSQRVDSFISQSTALLNDPSVTLTPGLVNTRIAQPLKDLENAIRSNPNIARCLMDRLGVWQTSVLTPLLHRAQLSVGTPDISMLRQGSDLLRSAHLLNLDCSVDEAAASNGLLTTARGMLGHAIASRDWAVAALDAREMVLLGADPARPILQAEVDADLHALLQGTSGSRALLEIARASYVLGDREDSAQAMKESVTRPRLVGHATAHKKKKKKKPKPKPATRPTPAPTPTPTSTPVPKTLEQVLSAGIGPMHVSASSDAFPVFSWQPAGSAARYVVTVTAADSRQLLWTWSGAATTVTFGDTALPGLPGTDGDSWPISLAGRTYTWSVLALDDHGQIVGASFGATQ